MIAYAILLAVVGNATHKIAAFAVERQHGIWIGLILLLFLFAIGKYLSVRFDL